MKSSTAPSHHPAWTGVSRALAWTLMGVGGATLVGWWMWVEELLQPFGAYSPLEASAAVGFLAVGAALILRETRPKLAAGFAGVAGLVGAIALLEHLTGRSLGIDRIFAPARAVLAGDPPGRMAPIVAISLVLVAAFVLVRIWFKPGARSLAALAAGG